MSLIRNKFPSLLSLPSLLINNSPGQEILNTSSFIHPSYMFIEHLLCTRPWGNISEEDRQSPCHPALAVWKGRLTSKNQQGCGL